MQKFSPDDDSLRDYYLELKKYEENKLVFDKESELFWANMWDLEDVVDVISGQYIDKEIIDFEFQFVEDHFLIIADGVLRPDEFQVELPVKLIWHLYETDSYFIVYVAGPDNFDSNLNEFLNSSETFTFNHGLKLVPNWIKTNAEWWAQDKIDDTTFISGIQFLIKDGLLDIPPTSKPIQETSSEIPSWIKGNAEFWAQGLISDEDFLNGIQYLVANGIIQV